MLVHQGRLLLKKGRILYEKCSRIPAVQGCLLFKDACCSKKAGFCMKNVQGSLLFKDACCSRTVQGCLLFKGVCCLRVSAVQNRSNLV